MLSISNTIHKENFQLYRSPVGKILAKQSFGFEYSGEKIGVLFEALVALRCSDGLVSRSSSTTSSVLKDCSPGVRVCDLSHGVAQAEKRVM